MAFCERCGAKIEEGVKYCARCGGKVETDSARSNQELFSPDAGIIGKLIYYCLNKRVIIWLIIAGMVLMVFQMFAGNNYVKEIQNLRHSAYPKLTAGETFDTLFDDKAKWNYNTDEECVTVSGRCVYGGKDVTMVVGISIEDGEAGNYQYVMIDGEYMDLWEMATIINDIYVFAYQQNGIPTDDIELGW